MSSSWITVKYGAVPARSSRVQFGAGPRFVPVAEYWMRGSLVYGETAASTSPPPGPFSDTNSRQLEYVWASTDSIASPMNCGHTGISG